ncbi:MAG: FHA domain-containing protein, partial [Nitrososphaeraceae archaeon]
PVVEEEPVPPCPEGQVLDEETGLCVLEESEEQPEAQEPQSAKEPEEQPYEEEQSDEEGNGSEDNSNNN